MSDFEPLLQERFERVRNQLDVALAAQAPRGKGRGIFRRELAMSVARLRTLQIDPEAPRTDKIEETLERTITALMPNGGWHNQFNPASGIGPDRRNRQSVDIVHNSATRKLMFLDFIELKRWDNRENDPLSAALEVYTYAIQVAYLYELSVSPYDSWRGWYPPFGGIRLWLLAPASYFTNFGGVLFVSRQLQSLANANSALAARAEFSSLALVKFSTTPVVLGPSITRLGFASHFDQDEVKRRVASNRSAGSPLELIRRKSCEELRAWVTEAFACAGLLPAQLCSANLGAGATN